MSDGKKENGAAPWSPLTDEVIELLERTLILVSVMARNATDEQLQAMIVEWTDMNLWPPSAMRFASFVRPRLRREQKRRKEAAK